MRSTFDPKAQVTHCSLLFGRGSQSEEGWLEEGGACFKQLNKQSVAFMYIRIILNCESWRASLVASEL